MKGLGILRSGWRPALGFALAVMLVSAAAPSSAALSPQLAAAGDVTELRLPTRLRHSFQALASGGLEDALRATAALLSLDLPEPPIVHAPVPVGVPQPVAGPVAALMAAVDQARELASGSVRASREALDRAVPAVLGPSPTDPLGALTRRSTERRQRLARHALRVARSIDRERLATAGLVLARALDQAIGDMNAGASSQIGAVTGCDVVDLPSLCIGGTGPNRYEEDETLLIDLGGDDTYANSAGGADPMGNGLTVSVSVDLAGNDRYEASLPTASGATVAHGSAVLGAVGILVDAAGEDTYTTTWTRTPAVGGFHADRAQAQGFALAGVGILADLEGNDRYQVENTAPAPDPDDLEAGVTVDQGALGMGLAVFGGLGVLMDAGTGDDSYLLASRPTPSVNDKGVLSPGLAGAQGFGFGGGGAAGLFLDGGGTDHMEIASEVATVDPENDAPLVGEAIAASRGFGASSLGGAGASVTGPGPTKRIARASLGAPWAKPRYIGTWTLASVQAFGYAEQESFAALMDQGGDDVYDAEAVSNTARRASFGDGCVCSLGAKGGPASVVGMAASTAGFAYLGDLAGNDQYRAAASSSITAEAHDARTTVGPDGARVSATGGQTYVAAHGFGGGVFGLLLPEGATGVLEDRAGDDVYESTASTRATAVATSALSGAPARAEAIAGDAASWSQAVGDVRARGELRDLGGADVYRSTASSDAHADPLHAESPGTVHSSVQGSVAQGGSALLLDLDGGADDEFSAVPPDPACEGTRGVGVWRDCGSTFGVGSNDGGELPNAPPPAQPTVASARLPAADAGGTLPCRPGSALVLPADYGCAGPPNDGSAPSTVQDVLPCPDPWEDHCEEWVARHNGNPTGAQEDAGFAVAMSPNGDAVFTAGASGTATGEFDFLVMAHDAGTGAERWVSTYDGPDPDGGSPDVATALAVDPSGHRVFATGQIAGPAGGDYGTVAYDAGTGDRLWVTRYEGPGGEQDVGWSVATDGQRVFVTGQSGPFGREDWATVAYDAGTGQELWAIRYDGPDCADGSPAEQADLPYWMTAHPGDPDDPDDTRVFVTGLSSGCDTSWDSTTIAYAGATGQSLWSARYHAGEWIDFATSIALNPDGQTVYVTGPSLGLLDEDYATIAYDTATGRQRWLSRYSGDAEGLDRAYSVTVSSDGQRVIVTGQSDGHGALSPDIRYATVAYDAESGAELWNRGYDGPGAFPLHDDAGYSVTVGSDSSRVFVTGTSSGVGGSSVGTVAYDAATGERLWVARYGGLNFGNSGIATVAHPSEPLVFVTGTAYEARTGLDTVTIAYRH